MDLKIVDENGHVHLVWEGIEQWVQDNESANDIRKEIKNVVDDINRERGQKNANNN